MARELKFRLGLTGGGKVKSDFESVGKDIRKVFKDIGRAVDSTAANFKTFNKNVAAFKQRVDALQRSAAGLRDGVGQIGAGLATVGRRVGVFTAAVGGLAAATFATAKASANAADAAQEQAAAVGLTVEQYGRLKFALEQGGVDAGSFTSAFVKFNKQIAAARAGTKSALTPFQALGVRLRDARGRALSASAVFSQIAERFSKLPNNIQKTVLATQLFGKSGAALIPTLNQGARGIRLLGNDAEKLGIVFTRQQAAIGDKFSDAANRGGQALVGLRNQIGLTFAPFITKSVDIFTASIVKNRAAIISTVETGWARLLSVVADVARLLQGRELQDNSWLFAARDNIQKFAAAISSAFNDVVLPIINRLRVAFGVVAEEINRIFGTNLTGDQLAIGLALLNLLGIFQVFIGSVTALSGVVGVLFNGLTALAALFPILKAGLVLVLTPAFALLRSAIIAIAPAALAAIAPLAALVGFPGAIVIAVAAVTAALYPFWDTINAGFQGVLDFATSVAKGIIALFSGVARVVGGVVGALTGSGSPGGVDVQRKATGGLIRGPGTGTSDSILARLSAGEYVLRASAVKSLGADFLDAMNFSGRIPAFADGGAVGSGGGRPVNLSLDGSTFAMSAGDDVVAALTKHARRRSLRSAVKAPSWVSKQ